MRRREFLKTTGAVLAAASLKGSAALGATKTPGGRVILPINRGWRYKAARVEGAELPAFDDGGFERVVVPHTNITLPWHNFDDRDYEFVSTYRRRFQYPSGAEGKRVFVDFEGAMTASTVWINGQPLGDYKGGYTPFSFELTPHLRKDAENVLVVQLDSTAVRV
jgi:beta-galactosidase